MSIVVAGKNEDVAAVTANRSEDLRSPLLMVRKAGVSFDSAFNIRINELKIMLDQYVEAAVELRRLQMAIVDRLHSLVPLCEDRGKRNLVLRVKRDVFTGRVLPEHSFDLPADISADLAQYSSLLKKKNEFVAAHHPDLMREIRHRLDMLTQHEEFRLAVEYSCPWLIEAYQRQNNDNKAEFSDEERGIYSYAVKLFSKANPFYSFASIGLPAPRIETSRYFCEIIFDKTVISALEKWALSTVTDPCQKFISLCSYEIQDEKCLFWVTERSGIRIVRLKRTALLSKILDYFSRDQEHTAGGLISHIMQWLPGASLQATQEALTVLIRKGIIREFLIRDFSQLKELSTTLNAEHADVLNRVQQLHFASVPKPGLPSLHREISAWYLPLPAETDRAPRNRYYVNTYETRDFAQHATLTEELRQELETIKPFFVLSNFWEHDYVISSFVRDHLKELPEKKLPYLEMVRAFERVKESVVNKYQPSVHGRKEKESYDSWQSMVAETQGTLDDALLDSLLRALPIKENQSESLCFNGPFNYATGTFYLSNIFAGGRRFGSRFLVGQKTGQDHSFQESDSFLDVQLALPLENNRDCVSAIFPAGCGFESRYRYKFKQWIDPAQITVELNGQRIIYRDSVSRKVLRLHFCGFLLAQFLSPEYKLLLAGHADCYHNPFDQYRPGGQEVEFVPGLQYRSICLRRQKWAVSRNLLDPVLQEKDVLHRTAALRELIDLQIAPGIENWYCRTLTGKPRYLDPNNPLSVSIFCRDVARDKDRFPVIFSPMDPAPDELLRQEDGHFMTELMVEV